MSKKRISLLTPTKDNKPDRYTGYIKFFRDYQVYWDGRDEMIMRNHVLIIQRSEAEYHSGRSYECEGKRVDFDRYNYYLMKED